MKIKIILSMVFLMFFLWGCDTVDDMSVSKIMVLDNYDPDYENQPFDDRLTIMDSGGVVERSQTGFNICDTIGCSRALSISSDGLYYVVCENVAYKLTKYNMSGSVIFSIDREFQAAFISGTLIYALTSPGTIGNGTICVIDNSGNVTREEPLYGFDIVVDEIRGFIWTVGDNIKKLDQNLNLLATLDPIIYCAISVDVDGDGSVWVAERSHSQVIGSRRRLIKLSTAGSFLFAIDLNVSPSCVRVDRVHDWVWVTCADGAYKYDTDGNELLSFSGGAGFSIDVDPGDGSVWIGSYDRVQHYESDGTLKGSYATGFSSYAQKYVAVDAH